ncbi:radical SAM family heme chaperone HemW [bacterium]|nr:radical SAM family heme chaperone HemW [bacterium]NUN44810.1 radical SAM family heme chaperone HemW [bacterium]
MSNKALKNKSFGIYVHIPFCERVCIYCDFFVTTARKYRPAFIESINREIHYVASQLEAPEARTIYLGGGTPSFLVDGQVTSILKSIYCNFKKVENCEITIEVNPNNVNSEKLDEFSRSGINRLSLGIQSLNNKELESLYRNHNRDQAVSAFVTARKAGFKNISVDVIFGLPGQTLENLQNTVTGIIKMDPEHISIYNLTIEERTYLHKMVKSKKVVLLDDEREFEMFSWLSEYLEKSGYSHYEISNFAKDGFESKHNSSYWNGLSYLGFGPSAHSFDNSRRWWNVRDLSTYIAYAGIENQKIIEAEEDLNINERITEFVFLNLRQKRGINKKVFLDTFGISFDAKFEKALYESEPYINNNSDVVFLNQAGMFLYNQVCLLFVKNLNE